MIIKTNKLTNKKSEVVTADGTNYKRKWYVFHFAIFDLQFHLSFLTIFSQSTWRESVLTNHMNKIISHANFLAIMTFINQSLTQIGLFKNVFLKNIHNHYIKRAKASARVCAQEVVGGVFHQHCKHLCSLSLELCLQDFPPGLYIQRTHAVLGQIFSTADVAVLSL